MCHAKGSARSRTLECLAGWYGIARHAEESRAADQQASRPPMTGPIAASNWHLTRKLQGWRLVKDYWIDSESRHFMLRTILLPRSSHVRRAAWNIPRETPLGVFVST